MLPAYANPYANPFIKHPKIPDNKNTNGNTRTDVATTGIKMIDITVLKIGLIFQLFTHFTKYPAAKPIIIAAKIPKLTLKIGPPPELGFGNSLGIPG